ncbi:hypothetical protein SNEBB_000320 [Seison nebaliae]|nr:hypothetical protein SNEBB_000320 [Seison nebaliae]
MLNMLTHFNMTKLVDPYQNGRINSKSRLLTAGKRSMRCISHDDWIQHKNRLRQLSIIRKNKEEKAQMIREDARNVNHTSLNKFQPSVTHNQEFDIIHGEKNIQSEISKPENKKQSWNLIV